MINKMHRTRELTTDSLNVKFGLKECDEVVNLAVKMLPLLQADKL